MINSFRIKKNGFKTKDWAHLKIPHKIIWEGQWDLDTLTQSTGIKDINGKEIFEGDYLKGADRNNGGPSEVFFDNGQWYPFAFLGIWDGSQYEIIGNVFDNLDLAPKITSSDEK